LDDSSDEEEDSSRKEDKDKDSNNEVNSNTDIGWGDNGSIDNTSNGSININAYGNTDEDNADVIQKESKFSDQNQEEGGQIIEEGDGGISHASVNDADTETDVGKVDANDNSNANAKAREDASVDTAAGTNPSSMPITTTAISPSPPLLQREDISTIPSAITTTTMAISPSHPSLRREEKDKAQNQDGKSTSMSSLYTIDQHQQIKNRTTAREIEREARCAPVSVGNKSKDANSLVRAGEETTLTLDSNKDNRERGDGEVDADVDDFNKGAIRCGRQSEETFRVDNRKDGRDNLDTAVGSGTNTSTDASIKAKTNIESRVPLSKYASFTDKSNPIVVSFPSDLLPPSPGNNCTENSDGKDKAVDDAHYKEEDVSAVASGNFDQPWPISKPTGGINTPREVIELDSESGERTIEDKGEGDQPQKESPAGSKSSVMNRETAIETISKHGRKTVEMNSDEGKLSLSESSKLVISDFIRGALRQYKMCRVKESDRLKPATIGASCLRCAHCEYASYRTMDGFVNSSVTGGPLNHVSYCKSLSEGAKKALRFLRQQWDQDDEAYSAVMAEVWQQLLDFGNQEQHKDLDGSHKTIAGGLVDISSPIENKDIDNRCKVRNSTSPISNLPAKVIALLNKAERSCSHESAHFPVAEKDRTLSTDFLYFTLRQFRLGEVIDKNANTAKQLGVGRLRCAHCRCRYDRYSQEKLNSGFRVLQSHVLSCEAISPDVQSILRKLQSIEQDQRNKKVKIINHNEISRRVWKRLQAERDGRSVDTDKGGFLTLIPYEPKSCERVASEQENLKPSESPRDDSSIDKPCLLKINEKKVISEDGLPTSTFTLVNEDQGFYYDFRIDIRDSLIPNSGYGAFLRLCRVRMKSKEEQLTTTRLPLVMKDEQGCLFDQGREMHVYLTPSNVHEDDASDCSDEFYEEVDTQTFSQKEFGIMEIGAYGPFLPSDLKWETLYDVKNFIFDFEPSRWNYGLDKPDVDGRKMMLDITDDITGDTHREARENISMYVNEVGHSPDLKMNVTPREDEDGNVHYFLDLEDPMAVGETIELLVDYGDKYEETRERHGYGKNNCASDQVAAERAKRNHAVRVDMENLINELPLDKLHELLRSLQTIVKKVFRCTQMCEYSNVDPKYMAKQFKAKIRINWISTIIEVYHEKLKSANKSGSTYHQKIAKLLDNIQLEWSSKFLDIIDKSDTAREILKNEIFEENVFLSSKEALLIHPIDPVIWCPIAQDLSAQIAKDLHLAYIMKKKTLAEVVERVYDLAESSGKLIKNWRNLRESNVFEFTLTTNETVSTHLKARISSRVGDDGEDPYLHVLESRCVRCVRVHSLVEKAQRENTTNLDEKWYLLWQVLRVTYAMATRIFPFEKETKNSLLETLCKRIGIDISEATSMLALPMVEPYGINYTSQYTDTTKLKRPDEYAKRKRVQKSSKLLKRRKLSTPLYEQVDNSLPEGWKIEYSFRKTGASAGHVDRYWFAPDGKKIRSRNEVTRYLDLLAVGRHKEFKSR